MDRILDSRTWLLNLFEFIGTENCDIVQSLFERILPIIMVGIPNLGPPGSYFTFENEWYLGTRFLQFTIDFQRWILTQHEHVMRPNIASRAPAVFQQLLFAASPSNTVVKLLFRINFFFLKSYTSFMFFSCLWMPWFFQNQGNNKHATSADAMLPNVSY